MKISLSILLLLITRLTTNKQKISIVGTWKMCKYYGDGIQVNQKSCPEIIFIQDGLGYYQGNKSKFKWKMNDSIIDFYFDSKNERKLFFSPYSRFTVMIETVNNLQYIKLTNKKSTNWYILSDVRK